MLLVAVAVLVPFAGLVAWGLLALREPVVVTAPPAVVPAPVAVVAPPPVVVVSPAPVEAAPVPVAAPAPVVEAAPVVAPVGEATEENVDEGKLAEIRARHAVFEQLTPKVADCFAQGKGAKLDKVDPAHAPPPKVLTTFSVHPDGTIADVQVKAHGRDPGLAACVTAALNNATVDPDRGIPQEPIRHAFHFRPTREEMPAGRHR